MLCDPAHVTGYGAVATLVDRGPCAQVALGSIRVSAGTAAVIGLQTIRQSEAPSTAYLMVGERCSHNCSFCAQARGSTSRSGFLSRVVWPIYPWRDTLEALMAGYERGDIRRCCLQVTVSRGCVQRSSELVRDLAARMSIPICVSIVPPGMDTVRTLLQVGAERVTIALDAACKGAYQAAKGDGWERRLGFLRQAANEFPGRIGTHLIVGLGETERDMVMRLQEMMDRGVTVGLFAFTPVAGTKWGNEQPPPLDSYRRIQAVWYLLRTKGIRFGDLSFTTDGQILSYGLEEDRLRHLLASGVAFQTAGCPDCNRPYYNERPGKALFNYPRPLIAKEIEDALAAVLAGRARSLGDDRRQ